jgi:protocatechuate 3,4-dioxygenase alpha subunit
MSDAGKDAAALVATPSQTVGPFFHFALTPNGSEGAVQPTAGTAPIQLVVRITDGAGQAVTDAIVEIWQTVDSPAGAAGDPAGNTICGFARLPTGEDGACTFETVRPGSLPDGSGGQAAPHINVCLFARGLLRQLHTRIYFADDPSLDGDAVLAFVPEERRTTLLAQPDPARGGRWLFHLRLQGADETVFFDV